MSSHANTSSERPSRRSSSAVRRYIRHYRRVPRDLVWDAIFTAAGRLGQHYPHDTLQIRAGRKRSLLEWIVPEGFAVEDNWTDLFEVVRKRRLSSSTWNESSQYRRQLRRLAGSCVSVPT